MSQASITCTDLTLRFPVYGVDAKSLKKAIARVAVGGRLGRHAGVTDVTALQSINLSLKAGDRLGLIGHNGSGKTTLLRALSGAYEPDEGMIDVHGHIAALLDLGLGIDPSATGYDNIRLRGRIAGLSSKEIEARMDEIGEFTGLGHPVWSGPTGYLAQARRQTQVERANGRVGFRGMRPRGAEGQAERKRSIQDRVDDLLGAKGRLRALG